MRIEALGPFKLVLTSTNEMEAAKESSVTECVRFSLTKVEILGGLCGSSFCGGNPFSISISGTLPALGSNDFEDH